jgi:hypothetical protein
MEKTSVGMADSESRLGATPIFDELVGRYGLTPLAEAVVGKAAEQSGVGEADRVEQVAVAS